MSAVTMPGMSPQLKLKVDQLDRIITGLGLQKQIAFALDRGDFATFERQAMNGNLGGTLARRGRDSPQPNR